MCMKLDKEKKEKLKKIVKSKKAMKILMFTFGLLGIMFYLLGSYLGKLNETVGNAFGWFGWILIAIAILIFGYISTFLSEKDNFLNKLIGIDDDKKEEKKSEKKEEPNQSIDSEKSKPEDRNVVELYEEPDSRYFGLQCPDCDNTERFKELKPDIIKCLDCLTVNGVEYFMGKDEDEDEE